MNNGRQIEISRRIYGRLVGLYPREHRKEYGTEMERLFTTNTWRPWQPGPIGIAAAVAVHPGRSVQKRPQGRFLFSPILGSWTSARRSPGRRLPWKGVALAGRYRARPYLLHKWAS